MDLPATAPGPDGLVTYKSPEELVKQTKDPSEPTVAINVRIPKSTRSFLEDVRRLWSMRAEARGEDSSYIDFSHVIRRMLKNGADGAFRSFGGRPTDEKAWKAVAEQVVANANNSPR